MTLPHSLLQCSLLRLLASGGGPAASSSSSSSGAASLIRQFSAAAASSSSSFTGSLRWNHNPHHIQQPTRPEVQVPDHEIEEGLPEVTVWLRERTGTHACTKMRQGGVTPCELSSLPGNASLSLAMDSRDAARLIREYGRNGLQARVLRLNIYEQQPPSQRQQQQAQQGAAGDASAAAAAAGGSSSSSSAASRHAAALRRQRLQDAQHAAAAAATAAAAAAAATPASDSASSSPAAAAAAAAAEAASSSSSPQQQHDQQPQPLASVRVLPKGVHLNSVSLAPEHFKLLFCPPDRTVRVDVPIKLWNADVAPGVRSGGWLHVVNRTVPLRAAGAAVPPFLELDVRGMRNKDVLRYSDVALPDGCVLAARDPRQPIVRCAVRVGGD